MSQHAGAESTIRFEIVDPQSDDAVAALTAYFAELATTFDGGFDQGDTLTVDAPAMRRPGGAFVCGYADGRVVSCGGIQRHDADTGEIKRMWVDGSRRGVGLGRRTLEELERVVGSLGYRRVVLDTNATLYAAITLYERAGYRPTERYNDNPYAHHWFEKVLADPRD